MQYITIRRYKRDDARGRYNIPYGTELEELDGKLWFDGKDVCGDHSAVMREYFCRNDDGHGLERGRLSRAIVKALAIRSGETREQHDERWSAVWESELCRKYRKPTQDGHWLWSIEFYNAPIGDLQHIAGLVGADIERVCG